jgi:hypothetical protein
VSDDISKTVAKTAEAIMASDPSDVGTKLNERLLQFISPHFGVRSASIVDETGKQSVSFPSVIYRLGDGAEHPQIAADQAAAAIDIYDEIDPDVFRKAYLRVSSAKALKKSAVTRGETRTNITLGMIFARRSSVPLNILADELYRLNSERPHSEWPDMLIVGSIGVINYAVQFPGERLSGDFLPPAEGASKTAPPAFYVVIVLRPTGRQSFNKLVSFLIGHLQFFFPDASKTLPNWSHILDGVSNGAITNLGFQFNLAGQLVPVPPDGYAGRDIPQSPITLEDPEGKVLSTLEYRKWQDGGVILLSGKLPLEGMLIFLPDVKAEYLRVIKRPNIQISPVLPLSRLQFEVFLQNIQRRSNFKVNKQSHGFVVQKFMDEGSATPFVARCTLGLLRIRENVLTNTSKRDSFDKIYQSTLSSLMTARTASQELDALWKNHSQRISSGEIAKITGINIQILESVDKKLSTEFESFLNASTRTIKTGIQGLGSQLGVDIGFLFKKRSTFENSIEKIRNNNPDLAEYLSESRNWTERLVLLRNDLEHEIWQFPRVTYVIDAGIVVPSEPKISNEPVTELVEFLFDRIECFFEEMIVHMLQRNLPSEMTLTEIAPAARTAEAPERFRITLALGGEAPWKIRHHAEKFDDI